MKTYTKRCLLILMSLCMLVSLAGCSATKGQRYKSYIKSLMSANYLGVTDEYVRTTGATPDEADAMYLQNVTRLADNLTSYYGFEISNDEELAPMMVEIAKKIYGKANYKVEKVYQDNNIYYVDVTISPINILNQTDADVKAYIEQFNQRVESGEFENYTKEEYENEFAGGIIDILSAAIDNIEYCEPETVSVRIIETEDSFYIGDEDFCALDMLVIATSDSEPDVASATDSAMDQEVPADETAEDPE